MDDTATIFNDLMQSVQGFSGELLGDFKHPLGRDQAPSSPARGAQDRAPNGHTV